MRVSAWAEPWPGPDAGLEQPGPGPVGHGGERRRGGPLDSDGRAGSRRRGGAKRLGVWESDGDSGGQDSDVLVLATGGLVCANRREFAPVRGSENRISDGLDRDSDEDPSHGGGPSFVPFKFLPGDRMIRIRSVGTLRTSVPPNLRTSEPPNSTAEHSSLRSEPARIWSESGPKPGRIRPGSHWQAGPVLTGRQVLDSWSEAKATRSRPSIGCNARVNAS